MPENDIYNIIVIKLGETEETNKVKIPLAIESGSRGWGFASADSDYDCRFVYVHEKDWYLSVFDKPDTIEYAAGNVYDINGWDLRKFIAHIVKSNAVTFEWLSSNVTYMRNEEITLLLRELAVSFFNPVSVSFHYLSLAYKKYKEIIKADSAKLKKYFYVLRPLANLSFIEHTGKQPYMEFFRTLEEIKIDKNVADEVARLAEIKRTADESLIIPRNKLLVDYFTSELNYHEERLKSFKFNKNRDYREADVVFRRIIEMTWNNG